MKVKLQIVMTETIGDAASYPVIVDEGMWDEMIRQSLAHGKALASVVAERLEKVASPGTMTLSLPRHLHGRLMNKARNDGLTPEEVVLDVLIDGLREEEEDDVSESGDLKIDDV